MKKKFAIYIRVSTQRQGNSGLGLDSQRKICLDFIKSRDGECVAEFKDIESGTHRDRKGLSDAIAYCNSNDCALVIATLSRLARDVEFCFKVVNTGIEIHFVDMPLLNTLLLGVFASVAQYERELTSERTRKALAAKKARGERTGGASEAWRETYERKTKEERKEDSMKRGKMKNERYIANKETQAFLKVLRSVFPAACEAEDPMSWDWSAINTKGEARDRILSLMKDYKELDESGSIFRKWDFTQSKERLVMLMRAHLSNVRRSVLNTERKELLSRIAKSSQSPTTDRYE